MSDSSSDYNSSEDPETKDKSLEERAKIRLDRSGKYNLHEVFFRGQDPKKLCYITVPLITEEGPPR